MQLDEGIAQTAIVTVEGSIMDLSPPYIYISIWAMNGVGKAEKVKDFISEQELLSRFYGKTGFFKIYPLLRLSAVSGLVCVENTR